MDTPNINTIKAMDKKELDTLNRTLHRKLAVNIVGMIFLKIAVPKVLGNIAAKAIIVAAKRA